LVNIRPGIPIAASCDDPGVKKRLKFIKESMVSIEDCDANILDVGCVCARVLAWVHQLLS